MLDLKNGNTDNIKDFFKMAKGNTPNKRKSFNKLNRRKRSNVNDVKVKTWGHWESKVSKERAYKGYIPKHYKPRNEKYLFEFKKPKNGIIIKTPIRKTLFDLCK